MAFYDYVYIYIYIYIYAYKAQKVFSDSNSLPEGAK